MDDRRIPIIGLEKASALLESIWPDQLGKDISEKMRLTSEQMQRIEARQETHLERANAVRAYCENLLLQEESDNQRDYGQKRRRFHR